MFMHDIIQTIYRVSQKKPLRTRCHFPKLFWNSRNISFTKIIAFQVIYQIAYRPANFCKTACPKRHLSLSLFLLFCEFYFDFLGLKIYL